MTTDNNVHLIPCKEITIMFKNINTISSAATDTVVTAFTAINTIAQSLNDLALAGKEQTGMILKISTHDCTKKQLELDNEIKKLKLSLKAKPIE